MQHFPLITGWYSCSRLVIPYILTIVIEHVDSLLLIQRREDRNPYNVNLEHHYRKGKCFYPYTPSICSPKFSQKLKASYILTRLDLVQNGEDRNPCNDDTEHYYRKGKMLIYLED